MDRTPVLRAGIPGRQLQNIHEHTAYTSGCATVLTTSAQYPHPIHASAHPSTA